MKKFFTIFLFLTIYFQSFSQTGGNNKPNISLGYGLPNIPALALSTEVESGASYGPILVAYDKWVSKKITAGVQLAFSQANSKLLTQPGYTYKYKIHLGTAMLRANFHYNHTKKIDMYSGLGLGYVLVWGNAFVYDGSGTPPKYTESASGFAFHINAFGIKYNIKPQWGIYTELGLGYNGLINFGAFLNL